MGFACVADDEGKKSQVGREECLSRGRVVRESALTPIRTDIHGGATVGGI